MFLNPAEHVGSDEWARGTLRVGVWPTVKCRRLGSNRKGCRAGRAAAGRVQSCQPREAQGGLLVLLRGSVALR